MTTVLLPAYITITQNEDLMTFLQDTFEYGSWDIRPGEEAALLIFENAEDATLFNLKYKRPPEWLLLRAARL